MTEASEKKEGVKTKQAEREERTRGQRSLIINVMLMFFVSIVVFVIGIYFFIVPRMVRQQLDAQYAAAEVRQLKRQISYLQQARVPGQPAKAVITATPVAVDKPAVSAPAKAAAPVKVAPVKAAPVKAAPVKVAPVKVAPVKAAPVKAAPAPKPAAVK